MQFLFVLVLSIVVASFVYRKGRRAGYEAGRIKEREEWATKIRELDE
jgi:hypothetical protein